MALRSTGCLSNGLQLFLYDENEISQSQYVDFLNSLTYDQQKAHTVSDPISAAGTFPIFNSQAYRNGIIILTPGNNAAIPAVYANDWTAGVENNTDDGANIAMNNMSWSDVAAYLDWSALRPMTELEFEKSCRAPLPRVAGEYPWGTTDIAFVPSYSGSVINKFLPNETLTPAVNGACAYGVNSSNASWGH
ncbi:SUMF1/EgtB/PvdO family nonheme iron enzyme [Flavobacterium sp. 3HN19-14]|uniref:SUMF1/EgtB/PvdO family nonheme iron enzyme n=1 Tax=Flavobacterium sp. 3HN19-14 TaxID=3448133 RepID=UPI003EE059A7